MSSTRFRQCQARPFWFVAAVTTLVACGTDRNGADATQLPARASSSRASAIVGGTTDLADPEVFMLELQFSNGLRSGCSATLIGERTLVTAAHCVDPRVAGATDVSIRATNLADVVS